MDQFNGKGNSSCAKNDKEGEELFHIVVMVEQH
jgi:hypothetical protein